MPERVHSDNDIEILNAAWLQFEKFIVSFGEQADVEVPKYGRLGVKRFSGELRLVLNRDTPIVSAPLTVRLQPELAEDLYREILLQSEIRRRDPVHCASVMRDLISSCNEDNG